MCILLSITGKFNNIKENIYLNSKRTHILIAKTKMTTYTVLSFIF